LVALALALALALAVAASLCPLTRQVSRFIDTYHSSQGPCQVSLSSPQ